MYNRIIHGHISNPWWDSYELDITRLDADLRARQENYERIRADNMSSAVKFFHVVDNTYREYRADFNYRRVKFRPYGKKYTILNENLPVKYSNSIKWIKEPDAEFTEVESKENVVQSEYQKILADIENLRKLEPKDYQHEPHRFSRSNLKHINLELCPPIEILENLHQHYEFLKRPPKIVLFKPKPRYVKPIEERVIKITYPESTEEEDREREVIFLQEMAEKLRKRNIIKETSNPSQQKIETHSAQSSTNVTKETEKSSSLSVNNETTVSLIESSVDMKETTSSSKPNLDIKQITPSLQSSVKVAKQTEKSSSLSVNNKTTVSLIESSADMKETASSSKPNLDIKQITPSLQSSVKVAKQAEKSSNESVNKKIIIPLIESSADMKETACSSKLNLDIKKISPSIKCSTISNAPSNPSIQKVNIKKGIHSRQSSAKIYKENVKSFNQSTDKKTTTHSIDTSLDTKNTAISSKENIGIKNTRSSIKCLTSFKDTANPSKIKVSTKKGVLCLLSARKFSEAFEDSSNESIEIIKTTELTIGTLPTIKPTIKKTVKSTKPKKNVKKGIHSLLGSGKITEVFFKSSNENIDIKSTSSTESSTSFKETANQSKQKVNIKKGVHSLLSSGKINDDFFKFSNESIETQTSTSSIEYLPDTIKTANSLTQNVDVKKITPTIKCSTSIKGTKNSSKLKVNINEGVHSLLSSGKIDDDFLKFSNQSIEKKTSTSSIEYLPDTIKTANSLKKNVDVKQITPSIKCSTSIKETKNLSKQKVSLKKGVHSLLSSGKAAKENVKSSNQSTDKKSTTYSANLSKQNVDIKKEIPTFNFNEKSNPILPENSKHLIKVTSSKYKFTESDHKMLKFYSKFLKKHHPSLVIDPVTTNLKTAVEIPNGKQPQNGGLKNKIFCSKKVSKKINAVTKLDVVSKDLPENKPQVESECKELRKISPYHKMCTKPTIKFKTNIRTTLPKVWEKQKLPKVWEVQKLPKDFNEKKLTKVSEEQFGVDDLTPVVENMDKNYETPPRLITRKVNDGGECDQTKHISFNLPAGRTGSKKELIRRSASVFAVHDIEDNSRPFMKTMMFSSQKASTLKKENDGVAIKKSKQIKFILPEKNPKKPEMDDFGKRVKKHEICTNLSLADIMYELKCPSTTALRKTLLHKALEVEFGVTNLPLFHKTMKVFSPTSSIMNLIEGKQHFTSTHKCKNVLKLGQSHHVQFNFFHKDNAAIKDHKDHKYKDIDELVNVNAALIKYFLYDKDIKFSQMFSYCKRINSSLKRKYEQIKEENEVKIIFMRDTTADKAAELDPLYWPSLENLAKGLALPTGFQVLDLDKVYSLDSVISIEQPFVEITLEKKQKFDDLTLLFKDNHLQRPLEEKELRSYYKPTIYDTPGHHPLLKPMRKHYNLLDPAYYSRSDEIVSLYATNNFDSVASTSQIDCLQNSCSSINEICTPLRKTPIVIKPNLRKNKVVKIKSDETLVQVTNLTTAENVISQKVKTTKHSTVHHDYLKRSAGFGKSNLQGKKVSSHNPTSEEFF